MTGSGQQAPFLVVGIGASAGGLAAFKSFLAHVPSDTGMAFVLVQHLDPNHKSLLVELLEPSSPISVVAARDGLEVKPNCVFVIPPDATLTIKDGILQLATPAPAREHRRPIDTFFMSLAEDCDESAIGIVLSGVGSDGTNGIRSIKERGGFTLAQAEFDATALQGMPSSAAATGLVDHVLPVEAMPAKLIDHRKHLIEIAEKKDENGNRRDIQEHLAKITALLHARSSHDFSGYKDATLTRRVQRRMQVLRIERAADYAERLKTDQREVEALFQELLIGVTQFFRDPETFDALKAMVVMPLLAAKRENEPVRVWVAGCSTGEEVYSLAILFKEALHELGGASRVTIFGTDIDAGAVVTARAGRYREFPAGLSSPRLERWFMKNGENYFPVPEIRDMCVFSTHSLVKDPPFSRLDLISCRNVLIYLDEDLQDRVMRTFHYALLPGGYLFLGTAESVTRNARLFRALDKKHRVMQRRDTGATLPAFKPEGIPSLEPLTPTPPRRHAADERIDKAVARVMQHYAPAYFVVDRNDEVTRFSGAETRHYLEPSQGAASLNLFNILLKSLRPAVRAGVTQALAESRRIINENLTIRMDGHVRALTLIVEPIGSENDAKASGGCMVAFRDSPPPPTTIEAPEANTDANVQALEFELRGTKAQLQAAIDELESRIQDMKATTEEFQALNEELQSSNEELETSKEEMQSVNEELQTINSELNSKNELLTRLNADMQNLLESTQIATVFLDDQLRIKHFTPALTQLFPIRDSDRRRPITDIVTELDYTTIRADVEKVQRDGGIVERDLAIRESDRAFVMRIRPYHTVRNTTDGVVITFVDITDRKRYEKALRESEQHFHALVSVSSQIVWRADASGAMVDDSPSWRTFTGQTYEQWKGFGWLDAIHPDDRERVSQAWQETIGERAAIEIDYRLQHVGGGWRWTRVRASPIYSDGQLISFAGMNTDISERKRVEEHLLLLVREMSHRIKNVFATVGALITMNARSVGTAKELANAIQGRLTALARAHELTRPGLINPGDEIGRGTTLHALIEAILSPYVSSEQERRVKTDGVEVVVAAGAVTNLALALHELATNAAKYGALSVATGRIMVSWTVDDGELRLKWQERGGPRIGGPPKHEGFGSLLTRRAVEDQFEGRISYDWESEGLVVHLSARADRLSA